MVTLPKEFVATKYPGYFWNITDKRLYSVKVAGELTPLTFSKANRWNHYVAGYKVSVRGEKRTLSIDYLHKLTPKNSVFPVAKELELA